MDKSRIARPFLLPKFILLLLLLSSGNAQFGEIASIVTSLLASGGGGAGLAGLGSAAGSGASLGAAAAGGSGAASSLGNIGTLYQLAQAALQLTGTGVGIANQASESAWFPVAVEHASKMNKDFQERLLQGGGGLGGFGGLGGAAGGRTKGSKSIGTEYGKEFGSGEEESSGAAGTEGIDENLLIASSSSGISRGSSSSSFSGIFPPLLQTSAPSAPSPSVIRPGNLPGLARLLPGEANGGNAEIVVPGRTTGGKKLVGIASVHEVPLSPPVLPSMTVESSVSPSLGSSSSSALLPGESPLPSSSLSSSSLASAAAESSPSSTLSISSPKITVKLPESLESSGMEKELPEIAGMVPKEEKFVPKTTIEQIETEFSTDNTELKEEKKEENAGIDAVKVKKLDTEGKEAEDGAEERGLEPLIPNGPHSGGLLHTLNMTHIEHAEEEEEQMGSSNENGGGGQKFAAHMVPGLKKLIGQLKMGNLSMAELDELEDQLAGNAEAAAGLARKNTEPPHGVAENGGAKEEEEDAGGEAKGHRGISNSNKKGERTRGGEKRSGNGGEHGAGGDGRHHPSGEASALDLAGTSSKDRHRQEASERNLAALRRGLDDLSEEEEEKRGNEHGEEQQHKGGSKKRGQEKADKEEEVEELLGVINGQQDPILRKIVNPNQATLPVILSLERPSSLTATKTNLKNDEHRRGGRQRAAAIHLTICSGDTSNGAKATNWHRIEGGGGGGEEGIGEGQQNERERIGSPARAFGTVSEQIGHRKQRRERQQLAGGDSAGNYRIANGTVRKEEEEEKQRAGKATTTIRPATSSTSRIVVRAKVPPIFTEPLETKVVKPEEKGQRVLVDAMVENAPRRQQNQQKFNGATTVVALPSNNKPSTITSGNGWNRTITMAQQQQQKGHRETNAQSTAARAAGQKGTRVGGPTAKWTNPIGGEAGNHLVEAQVGMVGGEHQQGQQRQNNNNQYNLGGWGGDGGWQQQQRQHIGQQQQQLHTPTSSTFGRNSNNQPVGLFQNQQQQPFYYNNGGGNYFVATQQQQQGGGGGEQFQQLQQQRKHQQRLAADDAVPQQQQQWQRQFPVRTIPPFNNQWQQTTPPSLVYHPFSSGTLLTLNQNAQHQHQSVQQPVAISRFLNNNGRR